jgi:aspartokinase
MAYQVSPTPNRRELDMLLTTGERISMSLMSMALADFGVPGEQREELAVILNPQSDLSRRILFIGGKSGTESRLRRRRMTVGVFPKTGVKAEASVK